MNRLAEFLKTGNGIREAVSAMSEFNPDETWTAVTE